MTKDEIAFAQDSRGVEPVKHIRLPGGLYYGWIIVATAFFSLALAYALRYSFTVLSVAIEDEFGWSRASIHVAFSIITLTYGFSGPVTGYLLDRFGPRVFMPVGAILVGVGLIGCSTISHLWQLYLFYSLAAIGMASLGTVCFGTLISHWFVKQRGTAWGVAASGTGFGMFVIVGFLVPYLISNHGFRMAYIVLGLTGIVLIAPITGMLLRRRPESIGVHADGKLVDTEQSVTIQQAVSQSSEAIGDDARAPFDMRWRNTDWTVYRAMRTYRFWAAFGCLSCFTLALYAVMMHQVRYAIDVGFDVGQASRAFGLMGFVAMVAKVGWGYLSDRIGRELTYSLGVICAIVGILIFMSISNGSQSLSLWAFAICFGLGYGVAMPIIPAIIADLFQGQALGRVMGLIFSGAAVFAAMGPPFAGYVHDLTGEYRIAFLSSIVLVSISAAFAWIASPRKVRPVGQRLDA